MRRIIGIVCALTTGALVVVPAVNAAGTATSAPQVARATTTVTATPTTPALVHPALRPKILLASVATRARVSVATLRAEWQHVAICEVNGNWAMDGPVYSGIGFLNSTWLEYGGRRFAPSAGRASRDAQILIGMRVTGGWVPDQEGCAPGGW
ncbi:MAG: transglycosylase family protein [Acidobacteriota bacterium]|nr:transglycosylase family protein [Acidobacteriota bacterium]MDE3044388.1 transglycosylase family protein [Acidobacteriota bacterium]MDE3107595.1 transglycosylase family protein [Acidobacteriota bacterium]MDE3223536.1 transglycosylase family protein [Acidobacteriota bacterium]